jgi:hypothetical protein
MFAKNLAIGSQGVVPKPKWDEYIDEKGVIHRQISGRFWDEVQFKPHGAGDYAEHVIFNAYQKDFTKVEITNAAGEKITVNRYPLPNILEADDAKALDEFIHWTEIFVVRPSDLHPTIILMNFYGLQNWPNAHFHIYIGAKQNRYWTVLDELIRAENNEWFNLDKWDLPYTRLTGTRNNDKMEENVLAINITEAIKTGDAWDYAKLRQVIEGLTAEIQPDLSPEQRRAPAAAGFGGYGSLVFLYGHGQAYYLIKEIPSP